MSYVEQSRQLIWAMLITPVNWLSDLFNLAEENY